MYRWLVSQIKGGRNECMRQSGHRMWCPSTFHRCGNGSGWKLAIAYSMDAPRSLGWCSCDFARAHAHPVSFSLGLYIHTSFVTTTRHESASSTKTQHEHVLDNNNETVQGFKFAIAVSPYRVSVCMYCEIYILWPMPTRQRFDHCRIRILKNPSPATPAALNSSFTYNHEWI